MKSLYACEFDMKTVSELIDNLREAEARGSYFYMSLSMTSHWGVRKIKGGSTNRKPEQGLHQLHFLLRVSSAVKAHHQTFKKVENKER